VSLSEALFSLRRAALLPPVQRYLLPHDRATGRNGAGAERPPRIPTSASPPAPQPPRGQRPRNLSYRCCRHAERATAYEFSAPVRTDRLVLRAMTSQDVDDIHAYQSRPDVCRYLMFEPRTREEVAEKVAKYSAHSC